MGSHLYISQALVQLAIQSGQLIQETVAAGTLSSEDLGQKEIGEGHIHDDSL